MTASSFPSMANNLSLPPVVDLNPSGASDSNPAKISLPTPQDLISHYQSQGFDAAEASIKVIEDLQSALYRLTPSNSAVSRGRKDKAFMAETSKKLDLVHNRLSSISAKLDSKPGYADTFSIGIASAAAFQGFEMVWPQVVEGISQIWSAVAAATDSSKPP